jgi:hypothetical protein
MTSPAEMRVALEAVLAQAVEIREAIEELTEIRNPITRRLALQDAQRRLNAFNRRFNIDLWRARFDLAIQWVTRPFRRMARPPAPPDSPTPGESPM